MEEVCRLCCSSRLVHNPIFDEESALYLKMSLYLPVKVFRGDGLPQKVCDRCSCRVNDLYQFCNEAIEAQARLRAALVVAGGADLTRVKRSTSPVAAVLADRAAQTDPPLKLEAEIDLSVIKDEPLDTYPDLGDEVHSDDSDVSLLALKEYKRNIVLDIPLPGTNGVCSTDRKRKRKNIELPPLAPPAVRAPAFDGPTRVPPAGTQLVLDDHYYCCTCFARLPTQNDMIDHYKQHAHDAVSDGSPAPLASAADDTRPTCTRCGQAFARRATFERHMREHSVRDRRPYRCALCEKTFKEAREIMKHSRTHRWRAAEAAPEPADKRFVCDLCPERFVYMRYLVAHRGTAHPDAPTPMVHRCVQCVRDFAHLNSLRRHLRSHNGERNFLCNVCGKALTSREHLKYHIRIHTGHKPHVCRVCGKGFVKKCNLTLHERVHSGEKPHVCSHCGKAFSQRSTLVIHERYHSGARPYVCPLCGRGFVARGLLSVHLKTTCI